MLFVRMSKDAAVCGVIALAGLLALTLAPGSAAADEHGGKDRIELRDGTSVEGEYLGGSGQVLRIRVGKDVRSIEVRDVRALRFAEREAPAGPARGRHVVATGTLVRVKLEESLSSADNDTGDRFRAVLLDDFAAPGRVLAKAGERIYGRVTRALRHAHRNREGELQLELAEVEVDGRRRPIKSRRHRVVSAADDGMTPRRGELRIPSGSVVEFALAQPFIVRDRNF